jgi:hypothetical protein
MQRLLGHREHELAALREISKRTEWKAENKRLSAENRELRAQVSERQDRLSEFVIQHREAKAAQRTAFLQEIANIRAAAEAHDVDLYGFILSALSPCINGRYDVDEESAKKVVARAASRLRLASRGGPQREVGE